METPQLSQGTMYLLISKAALALTTILEAMDAIDRIAREADSDQEHKEI